jgi:hypothetical protein
LLRRFVWSTRPPKETIWSPPAETVVEWAWPPDETYSMPRKVTVVLDVVPPPRTSRLTPLPTVKLLSW